MQRCLSLAESALGNTYPNPLVGSVVVYKHKIIGEGWHQKAGEAHAEVNAIKQVIDKSLLSDATLYVNLEPCSHFGKTPPCADLIIKHGINRVVIASKDPNPQVAGQGIVKLQRAGIEVIEGVLRKEAEFLNRRFYTFHKKKRPYIILKWAQTQDRFIAPLKKETRRPFWISNKLARQKVHQWRSQESSILVGIQTVIEDNPILNTREWPGNNPLRLILDPSDRIPLDATILQDELSSIIFNKQIANRSLKNRKEHVVLNPFNLNTLMKFCYDRSVLSVIVEGGQKTLDHFIEQNLWDEARVFTSENELREGIKSPEFKNVSSEKEKFGNTLLETYFR